MELDTGAAVSQLDYQRIIKRVTLQKAFMHFEMHRGEILTPGVSLQQKRLIEVVLTTYHHSFSLEVSSPICLCAKFSPPAEEQLVQIPFRIRKVQSDIQSQSTNQPFLWSILESLSPSSHLSHQALTLQTKSS